MIKTDIKVSTDYTPDTVRQALREKLPLTAEELRDFQIVRRIVNIKDKGNIHYDMTVALDLSPEREAGLLKIRNKVKPHDPLTLAVPRARLTSRPVVVGAGPAGLFAALILAEAGAQPILVERGLPVEDRKKSVDLFNALGILDPDSNVQFGEGGAGTYSDGKLKIGSHDKYKMKVLRTLHELGAPDEILFSMNGHLGTDKLSDLIRALRERLISLGTTVLFSTKLVGIDVKNKAVSATRVAKNGKIDVIDTENVVLATGHSARDSFHLLRDLGLPMEPRGFGIGMRIEHPREYTDRITYGGDTPAGLGAASYHLVTHLPNGRSVYSFCMCPGGTVVAGASEQGGVVTNGMSEFGRDGDNSNAAFLVSLTPSDFGTSDPLGGFILQEQIERAAFAAGGGDYLAPAIKMSDFLSDSAPTPFGSVRPSYPRGTTLARPKDYLPESVTDSLRAAIADFDAWMPGFSYPDAVMTGAETRSTSPVRILRGDDFSAVGFDGIYPAGEGGGYSGGIISSAADGVRVAIAILEKYKID